MTSPAPETKQDAGISDAGEDLTYADIVWGQFKRNKDFILGFMQ